MHAVRQERRIVTRWLDNPRLAVVRRCVVTLHHSRRARRWALGIVIALVLYGLLGFFAAPPIIRSQIQQQASNALGRRVTIGHVRFDPYTLRLQLNRLRIAGRTGQPPFVRVDRAIINASWTSLLRRAPVLDALILERPRIRIVRSAQGRYNFSDILARLAARAGQPASPFRYAVSNLRVHDGDVAFDDGVTHSRHQLSRIELGIPFIANLPRDTDAYVQPLLAMQIDGSPFGMAGQTKPFAGTRESTLAFHVQRLDLSRYAGYAPATLPFRIPRGTVSGDLTLHFAQAASMPQVRLSGALQLDDFALESPQRQPVFTLTHGSIQLADVEPLVSRYLLGTLQLDGAQVWYTQTAAGHSNFDNLTRQTTVAQGAKPAPPTDLRIAALILKNGAVHYADAAQHPLTVGNLDGRATGLSLLAAPPAKVKLAGKLDGGSVSAKGTLDLAASRLAAALQLQQVGLAPLQGVAAMPLDGHTATGKLSAAGQLQLDWGTPFNVQLAAVRARVSDFALQPAARSAAAPVAWQRLDFSINTLDLAKHTAQLGAITADGLQLDLQRDAARRINLLHLLAPGAGDSTATKTPPWHWRIAQVGFTRAAVAFTDHGAGPKPVTVRLDHLAGSIAPLSDDLGAASKVKLSGASGHGTFAIDGTLQPAPLAADLAVTTQRLGIAALEPYLGVPLNVTLSRAQLTSHGQFHYDARGATPKIAFHGDAALANVSIQDKLTGDDFLRWRTLRATRIDANVGTGAPRVDIGGLALTAFYMRMIINADGRLNVSDVIANPAAAPVSVTRTNPGTATGPHAAPPPAPASAAATASAAAAGAAPAARLHIGGIRLAYGQLNFTDDFIKPHYTANLTRLNGDIGAFGSAPNAPPARIKIDAALNGNAPVAINGTLNPLQPVATLAVTGRATGVELTRISAYATRYTGYPITGGRLTANVNYHLDHRQLSADNHLFITQISFGPRDESPGINHLPVKLAVALLKDQNGNVNIDLPVSGSLDDPQFSVGGLVWRAVVGLIGKAITSPFRLLASAFGGNHQDHLDYVVFAPGSAVLDPPAAARLARVATMLRQKPGLTLQLTGRVDPAKDVAGLRKVTVDDLIRRAKVLDTEGKRADTSAAALAEVQITPDEYVKYLRRAYRHDAFKGKPNDFLGLKLPSPAEMRKLMAASVATNDAALRALAERRTAAVQAALAGKLAANRIVVEPPKLSAAGISDQGPATRVQLGVAQR
ncbi:MAG: DUF748 domain-containing protein [Rhodanobacteraceae bacterium]|nr:MAG: DUF748 domain-containing protein [Rhodanobacteraceae bacterium]